MIEELREMKRCRFKRSLINYTCGTENVQFVDPIVT